MFFSHRIDLENRWVEEIKNIKEKKDKSLNLGVVGEVPSGHI